VLWHKRPAGRLGGWGRALGGGEIQVAQLPQAPAQSMLPLLLCCCSCDWSKAAAATAAAICAALAACCVISSAAQTQHLSPRYHLCTSTAPVACATGAHEGRPGPPQPTRPTPRTCSTLPHQDSRMRRATSSLQNWRCALSSGSSTYRAHLQHGVHQQQGREQNAAAALTLVLRSTGRMADSKGLRRPICMHFTAWGLEGRSLCKSMGSVGAQGPSTLQRQSACCPRSLTSAALSQPTVSKGPRTLFRRNSEWHF